MIRLAIEAEAEDYLPIRLARVYRAARCLRSCRDVEVTATVPEMWADAQVDIANL